MSKTIEYIVPGFKDWSNAGYELEVIGRQLDSARQAKARSEHKSWAKKYWTQVEAVLLRKWKGTIQLEDVGMRQLIEKPVEIVSYDWWEKSEEIAGFGTNWYRDLAEKLAGGPNLEESWTNAIEQKVQKARQALA